MSTGVKMYQSSVMTKTVALTKQAPNGGNWVYLSIHICF